MKTTPAVLLGSVLAAGVWVGPLPVHAAEPAVRGADAQTAAYEARLNDALQTMLDSIVGPGHAVVTSAVEWDLDSVETVRKTYTRDPAVGALSERLSRSYYTDTSGTRYESSSTVRTNALNQWYETRRKAPGDIKRLSIAVAVDRAVDVAPLRTLVSTAAGADPGRGDAIVVTVMPLHLNTAGAVNTDPAAGALPAVTGQSVLLAAVLVLLVVILLVAIRRRGRRPHRAPVTPVRPYRLDDRHPVVAVGADPVPALDRSRADRPGRTRMIGQMAGDDPRRTALVLRDWVGHGS